MKEWDIETERDFLCVGLSLIACESGAGFHSWQECGTQSEGPSGKDSST